MAWYASASVSAAASSDISLQVKPDEAVSPNAGNKRRFDFAALGSKAECRFGMPNDCNIVPSKKIFSAK